MAMLEIPLKAALRSRGTFTNCFELSTREEGNRQPTATRAKGRWESLGLRVGPAGVGSRPDVEPAGFGRGRAESAALWLPRLHRDRARGDRTGRFGGASRELRPPHRLPAQAAPPEGASQSAAPCLDCRDKPGGDAGRSRAGGPNAPRSLDQSPAPAMIQKVEGPMGSSEQPRWGRDLGGARARQAVSRAGSPRAAGDGPRVAGIPAGARLGERRCGSQPRVEGGFP